MSERNDGYTRALTPTGAKHLVSSILKQIDLDDRTDWVELERLKERRRVKRLRWRVYNLRVKILTTKRPRPCSPTKLLSLPLMRSSQPAPRRPVSVQQWLEHFSAASSESQPEKETV